MDEDALESSSEEGSSLDEPTWVSWFCMLRNHEFFCEVDPAFVQDRFNLYGLKEIVGPLYGEAMTMILGYAPTGSSPPPLPPKFLPLFPGKYCSSGTFEPDIVDLLFLNIVAPLTLRQPLTLDIAPPRLLPPLDRTLGLNVRRPFVLNSIAEKQLADPSQRIHKVLEPARILYGLIHARYILTAQGLSDMVRSPPLN